MFLSVSKQKAAVWTGKVRNWLLTHSLRWLLGGPATLPLPGDTGLGVDACGVSGEEREAN